MGAQWPSLAGPPRMVRRFTPKLRVGSALDVGCGQGAISRWLAGRGYRCVSFDRELPADLRTHPRVEFQRADARTFDYGRERFDVAIALNVLSFLEPPDLWRVLGEMWSSLRVGGRLILRAFTVEDPAFRSTPDEHRSREWHNHVWSPSRAMYITYLGGDELLRWSNLRDAKLLLNEMAVLPDDHPPYGPHRHALVSFACEKRAPESPPYGS
jgi:SAM-dependent methyltransferase